MATIIIIIHATNNAKFRKRIKTGRHYLKKDINKILNKELEKALLRLDNPRQKLVEFREQIETNTRIFASKQKYQNSKKLNIHYSKHY